MVKQLQRLRAAHVSKVFCVDIRGYGPDDIVDLLVSLAAGPSNENWSAIPMLSAAERHNSPAGAAFATPGLLVRRLLGPNQQSDQYSQGPGTQRKTSPSTATWQTDGNDR